MVSRAHQGKTRKEFTLELPELTKASNNLPNLGNHIGFCSFYEETDIFKGVKMKSPKDLNRTARVSLTSEPRKLESWLLLPFNCENYIIFEYTRLMFAPFTVYQVKEK